MQGTYTNILSDEGLRAQNNFNSFLYSLTDTHFDEANLYYHVNKVRTNYFNNLGFSGFQQITAHAHHSGFSSPNAGFRPDNNELYFSDGDGIAGYNSFAREDKIIYHEYTHAVTYNIAHLPVTYTETGAINEGNSDYFAGSFTGRSLIGEYSSYGISINQRNMTNPRIGTYSEYQSYTGYPSVEPHIGSELWSSCLWSLRSNIGQYYTDRLIYNGLFGIPTNSSFLQYRQKIIDYDISSYGGVHAQTIRHTFYLKGIGPDYLQVSNISGPGTLSFKEIGTYTPNIIGGSGSVTCQWYRSNDGGITWYLVGTALSLNSTMNYFDFIIRCDVHDTQTGENASATKNVYYGINKVAAEQTELIEENYSLFQNYPNPFNPSTEIKFTIKNDGFVTLKIYNSLGKEIVILVNGYKSAGDYSIQFVADNLPSGVYFYKLESGKFKEVKKMILLR